MPGAVRRRGVRGPAAQPDARASRSRSASASGAAVARARPAPTRGAGRQRLGRGRGRDDAGRADRRRRSTRPTGRSTARSAAAATASSRSRSSGRPLRYHRRCPYHRAVAPRSATSLASRPIRRRRARPDEARRRAADLTNGDLARVFHEIGDILEVKGELAFKTVAYHRAADAIGRSPVDLVAGLPRPATRRRSRASARRSATRSPSWPRPAAWRYHERLRAEFPASLVELLQIPGLGPKTVRQLHEELGIQTLDDLEAAAEAGRLRGLRGLSERTEALILEGIERLERSPRRMLLEPGARRSSTTLLAQLGLDARASPRSCRPARSAGGRRRSATSTSSPRPTDPDALMARFTGLGAVDARDRAGRPQGRRPPAARPAGRPDGRCRPARPAPT